MYKKEVKKKGRTYIYYYHNVRGQGRIRNICLGSDLKNAKERLYNIRNESYNLLDNAPERKVYSSLEEFREETLNLFSYNVMNLPSKSSGFIPSINLENSFIRDSDLSCGILNQTIENIFSLLYKDLSVKSQSLVTNTLCSDLDNSAILPFESPLGLKSTSKSFLRNCNNSFLTFSSSRNFSFLSFDVNDDIIIPPSETSCIMQSCFNMFFCEWYKECIKNFFYWNSSFKHFKNLPNHDPSSFEGWLSMTDFAVNNNIFVNFNSHKTKDDGEIFKSIENFSLTGFSHVYKSIKDSEENPENLVLLQNLNEIKVDILKKNV